MSFIPKCFSRVLKEFWKRDSIRTLESTTKKEMPGENKAKEKAWRSACLKCLKIRKRNVTYFIQFGYDLITFLKRNAHLIFPSLSLALDERRNVMNCFGFVTDVRDCLFPRNKKLDFAGCLSHINLNQAVACMIMRQGYQTSKTFSSLCCWSVSNPMTTVIHLVCKHLKIMNGKIQVTLTSA